MPRSSGSRLPGRPAGRALHQPEECAFALFHQNRDATVGPRSRTTRRLPSSWRCDCANDVPAEFGVNLVEKIRKYFGANATALPSVTIFESLDTPCKCGLARGLAGARPGLRLDSRQPSPARCPCG